MMERHAQTLRIVFDFTLKKKILFDQQVPYWGEMYGNRLSGDDSYDVFLTRNIECLELCPIMKKTFVLIFLRSLEASQSINSLNRKNSPHFESVFEKYRDFFSRGI